MSTLNIRPFDTPPDLIVPTASRKVTTPVGGSSAIVMSDLVPTVTITPSWPIKDVSTYGGIDYSNRTEQHAAFAGWIYKKMTQDPHDDMTRLVFAPDLSATANTPYDEFYTSDVITWPAVLEFFRTFRNPNAPIAVPISADETRYIPRFTVVYGLRRSVSGHCKMRVRKFVSDKPFDLAGKIFQMFQPTDIMWDMPGTSGSIERCLHERQKVRAARDNMNWAVDTPRYMVFPETNLTEWRSLTWNEQERVDVLYSMTEYTIYPPAPPEVSVYVE